MGSCLPCEIRYARAANHETYTTGLARGASAPGSRSLFQCRRYDATVNSRLARDRRHPGRARQLGSAAGETAAGKEHTARIRTLGHRVMHRFFRMKIVATRPHRDIVLKHIYLAI